MYDASFSRPRLTCGASFDRCMLFGATLVLFGCALGASVSMILANTPHKLG
ncbi:hypothetical protein Lalb_Chr10g0093071 [Lupinus albus]|uniref:Uncharacterized protein n=1 Tax=Lupinus albus TaxID=3870 RepID=A0A6A4PTS1_LUPAL|nr:hypothetical protein Lalb_Chr10g0093071 [Lupinus albus]